jgi:hypothetical protein
MPLRIGTLTPSKLYLGSTEVTKAYLGAVEVYSSGPAFDADALAYITAVETEDGQALESGVRTAINDFVVGCKADGIWGAIKASCILAGARTLTAALKPLVGPAPTSFNFVSGDYDRKTGLVGDGSTKYLNSNRAGNADPQNNKHLATYIGATSAKTTLSLLMCDGINGVEVVSQIGINPGAGNFATRANNTSGDGSALYGGVGFYGISRSVAASYVARGSATNNTITRSSQTPNTANTGVFMRTANPTSTPAQVYDGRLAFYSIGESLDLAQLDSRVSTLITAIAAAIP